MTASCLWMHGVVPVDARRCTFFARSLSDKIKKPLGQWKTGAVGGRAGARVRSRLQFAHIFTWMSSRLAHAERTEALHMKSLILLFFCACFDHARGLYLKKRRKNTGIRVARKDQTWPRSGQTHRRHGFPFRQSRGGDRRAGRAPCAAGLSTADSVSLFIGLSIHPGMAGASAARA